MLWVYGHFKYFLSYSAGIDFRRQTLASKVDPRAVRVKTLSKPVFTTEHNNGNFLIYNTWVVCRVYVLRFFFGDVNAFILWQGYHQQLLSSLMCIISSRPIHITPWYFLIKLKNVYYTFMMQKERQW